MIDCTNGICGCGYRRQQLLVLFVLWQSISRENVIEEKIIIESKLGTLYLIMW